MMATAPTRRSRPKRQLLRNTDPFGDPGFVAGLLRRPQRMNPSQWAEAHRVLTRRQSVHSGRWNNAHAPYLVGIMDAVTLPGIQEIALLKATQVGGSEATRNILGWIADSEPDPALLVLPDERSGKEIIDKRIIPLFQDTPTLRAKLTDRAWDVKLHSITLTNGFDFHLAWAGSPAALASHPKRWVINDEIDKHPRWSGREAAPRALAYERTKTYKERKKIIDVSTPTTREGPIWQLWQDANIQLDYYVPCPQCRHWQRLVFDQVRWDPPSDGEPAKDHMARIVADRAAWYECCACHARLSDADRHAMVLDGRWATESAVRDQPDALAATPRWGICQAGWSKGVRLAMRIDSIACLWINLADVAFAFLDSIGDPAKLMNFRNSWLAEIFEQQIASTSETVFASRCVDAAPEGVVPEWATALVASVDVQLNHVYYVVRAWCGRRSRRISHGIIDAPKDHPEAFETLRRAVLEVGWQREGGGTVEIEALGIDAQFRTPEVHAFAASDPARIKAVAGSDRRMKRAVQVSDVFSSENRRKRARGRIATKLYAFDGHYFKDMLATLVAAQTADGGDLWELNANADEDYNRQLAAEHKIRDPQSGDESWVPVTAGRANHYLDCEVGQLVLCHVLNIHERASQPPRRRSWAERRAKRSGRRWR